MPFHDDFESGLLQSYWAVSGTGGHNAQVTPLNGPGEGEFHLTLDSFNGVRSRNEVTLGLDLAGYTNVVLRFLARSYGEEPDGPPPSPFLGGADFDGVAVSPDGVTWNEVQSLRSLTSAYRPVTVDLDAALAALGLGYNDHFRIRFNQVDDFQIPFDGIGLDDISVTGLGVRRLNLSLPATATEGAGVLTNLAAVWLGAPAAAPVTVRLTVDRPGKVMIPSTVTIAAGAALAFFPIAVLDDALLEGPIPLLIRAEADGVVGGVGVMRIADNERASLQLRLPPWAREGDGRLARRGRIRSSARPARDVRIQLVSSDPAHLRVPGVVVLPAGSNVVHFDLVVGDDDRIDGAHEVEVTAEVANWGRASDRMRIMENDSPALFVTLPATVGENAGTWTNAGQVRLSGRLPYPVTVTLRSSDPSVLTVPPEVRFPSNQLEAAFNLTPVNNTRVDGRRDVAVSARASGFAPGSAGMSVEDDETPPAPTQPFPVDNATNVPVSVSLAWNPGVGDVLRNGGFEAADFSGWSQVNGGYGGWVLNDGKVNPDGPEEPSEPRAGKLSALLVQIGRSESTRLNSSHGGISRMPSSA